MDLSFGQNDMAAPKLNIIWSLRHHFLNPYDPRYSEEKIYFICQSIKIGFEGRVPTDYTMT